MFSSYSAVGVHNQIVFLYVIQKARQALEKKKLCGIQLLLQYAA